MDGLVELSGVKIHYEEHGSGPALVMLHGGGPGASGISNFRLNLPALSERFRVILVDQPGFGASDKRLPDGESFFGFSARAVGAVLDTLGVERAHLLGNSLGGGTALRMALDAPDRTDRLVLMGPGGGAVNVLTAGSIVGLVTQIVARFCAEPTLEGMQEILRFMVFDPSVIHDRVVQERFEAAAEPDALEFIKTLFPRMAQQGDIDLWKEVDRVSNKTLLIWGREDRILPLDSSLLMLNRMPDVRLLVFSGCGHWAMVEKRPEFDAAVLNFLLTD